MVIALGVTSAGAHCRLGRRNHNQRITLLGQYRFGNCVCIIGAITNESFKGSVNLVEQICNGGGVTNLRGGEFAGQKLVVFIDRQMQLAPCSASGNSMFLLVPFVTAKY